MILTHEQIVQLIKEPNAGLLDEMRLASIHDDRCSMHTEPEEQKERIPYLVNLLEWVKDIIDSSKFQVFEHLLRLPAPTVEIINGIVDELAKIFEAQDRHVDFNFSNPDLKADFEEYRKKINEINFWHTQGFQMMKSAVNNFLVIDLPEKQNGKFPEPYFYFVRPCHVRGAMLKRDYTLEYFIYYGQDSATGKPFWYCFDDAGMKKLAFEEPHELLADVKFDVGYCTARPFWTTPYNKTREIQKQNPITKSLATIDWLLYSKTSGNHLALYAGFPVMVSYQQKCTYMDDMTHTPCEGGWLYIPDSAAGPRACPMCSATSKLFGPGTHVTAPAPASKDDPDLIAGVNMIGADTESLKWMSGDIDAQVAWITYNIVGKEEPLTKEAVNEKQVAGSFESRMRVFANVRENFEAIQKFTDDTLARMRYGGKFVSSVVKYGTNVLLYTAQQMQQAYQEGKKNGDPIYELSAKRMAIIEAQYKNNPDMKQRMIILGMLEPYADLTPTELWGTGGLNSATPLDPILLRMKANLPYYIARFERENMDVVSFMKFSPLNQKIDFINAMIRGYIEEEEVEETTTADQTTAAPAAA